MSFCGSVRLVASSSWLPAVARDCADLAPLERVFFLVDTDLVLVEVMNMYTPKKLTFFLKMDGWKMFISFLGFGPFLVSRGVFLSSMGKFNGHFFLQGFGIANLR